MFESGWKFLTIWDLILTPLYLVILITIAKKMMAKYYPKGHVLRNLYLKGLYLKFLGAILIGIIYAYYYEGGDTFNYFNHAKVINSADSFETWLKLMLSISPNEDPKLYNYVIQMEWYGDPSTYTIAKIAAIFGLFNGTSYIPIALLFAFFSYHSIWAMYRTFIEIYPHLFKELALAFLFIPGVIVWGSSIFKDTVCMFGLGWLTYSTFRLFVNRDFSYKNVVFIIFSFYLIAIVKVYIIMAFMPALLAWILLTYSKKITNIGLRWIINLGFLLLTLFGFTFFAQKFSKDLNRYSLENLATTSSVTRSWITYVSSTDNGSSYDLGNFEPTAVGMLSKFPQAVTVTLFRPFLWESKKVIVFLSSLEALIFAYFTFQALRKKGNIRLIFKDPTVLFCFIFSLIFAFAVGISSYNFGALSRYKIPCLPFYAAFLIILINNKGKHSYEKSAIKLPE